MFVLLAACGTIKEAAGTKEIEYKSTRTVPSLEVPPDLSTTVGDDRLAIPGAQSASYSELAGGRGAQAAPGTVQVLPTATNARLERAGAQRWLVINASPDAVWPTLREFWIENGLTLAKENPRTGVMETEWAENRTNITSDLFQALLGKYIGSKYSSGFLDKFRVRIERGREEGTTELYLSHQGMVERVSELTGTESVTTYWEPRPADPDLEAEMLRRLLLQFGVAEERATTMTAKAGDAAPPAAARATISSAEGGHKVLTVADNFESAWRRVGLALDRVGFTVEDRDRAQGMYYVRYVDPDAGGGKPGFFSRIFGGKKELDDYNYQVKMVESGADTQITVLDTSGSPDRSGTGDRILGLLYDQLR
jgi:outer membrane protein assembly factor BamC